MQQRLGMETVSKFVVDYVVARSPFDDKFVVPVKGVNVFSSGGYLCRHYEIANNDVDAD
jgi:hypothetical protein